MQNEGDEWEVLEEVEYGLAKAPWPTLEDAAANWDFAHEFGQPVLTSTVPSTPSRSYAAVVGHGRPRLPQPLRWRPAKASSQAARSDPTEQCKPSDRPEVLPRWGDVYSKKPQRHSGGF